MRPLVSIVMATYNGEKYVRQQLESILNQSYENIELVIVDDASSDSTLEILREYAASDKRVHLYQAEKNSGVIATFERGINLARGEFIALSDQDDIFHKDKIALLSDALNNQPDCDLALSDLALIDSNNQEIAASMWQYQNLNPSSGRPFQQLIYINFATGCAIMFRRRLLAIALPFPPDCIMHDWWLAVAAASMKGGGIALVDRPLTFYRQHSSNVLGAHSGKFRSAIKRVPTLNKRIEWYKKNLTRILGYSKKSFWGSEDLATIAEVRSLFESLIIDDTNSFFSRISGLPKRLKYATRVSFMHIIYIIGVTIWPRAVDCLQRYVAIERVAKH